MIITSLQQAEAAGQVHRDAGVSRYPLVGPVTVGGATGDVSLLVLPPGTTHTLSAGASEQVSVVVRGAAELSGVPAPVGTVAHAAVGQSVSVRALDTGVTLLHLQGAGQARTGDGAEPRGQAARVFGIDEVAETPTNRPELGFFHMTARLLVDGPSRGHRSFTVGLGTFAPGGGCHGLHRHANAGEAFYVWDGEGAHLSQDGAEHPMTSGQLVWVTPDEWHGFRNTGTTPVRALFCYLGVDSLSKAGYEVLPVRGNI